jgi:uncharacterized Zn-binding protein involved in type VI secretion
MIAISLIALFPAPLLAQDLPACALTGSMTMTIEGKPALRLSDVANCPPELYEIIRSVTIDGQPRVHFKPAPTGKLRCFTLNTPTVSAEGRQAAVLGGTTCSVLR